MTVTLMPGSRKFEVTAGDSLVVSGGYMLEEEESVVELLGEKDDGLELQPDGIYKVG